MLPSALPEIQRTHLVHMVLQLKAMGINDLVNFGFMDPPPEQTLINALRTLYVLGALDEEGLLTRLGRKMAEFPLEPQLAKILLAAVDLGCADEVMMVVAMLSVKEIFYRPKEKQTRAQAEEKHAEFSQRESDHLTLLTVFRGYAASNFSHLWCDQHFSQLKG